MILLHNSWLEVLVMGVGFQTSILYNLGMFLVSKPFDGMGFGSWKRSIELALTARIKMGFINGSC